jgi:hypothetical protein
MTELATASSSGPGTTRPGDLVAVQNGHGQRGGWHAPIFMPTAEGTTDGFTSASMAVYDPQGKRAAPKRGWESPEPDREPSVMPVGGKRQMSELQIFCIVIGCIGFGGIALIGLLISLKATGVFVPLALIGLGAAVLLNDRRSF